MTLLLWSMASLLWNNKNDPPAVIYGCCNVSNNCSSKSKIKFEGHRSMSPRLKPLSDNKIRAKSHQVQDQIIERSWLVKEVRSQGQKVKFESQGHTIGKFHQEQGQTYDMEFPSSSTWGRFEMRVFSLLCRLKSNSLFIFILTCKPQVHQTSWTLLLQLDLHSLLCWNGETTET